MPVSAASPIAARHTAGYGLALLGLLVWMLGALAHAAEHAQTSAKAVGEVVFIQGMATAQQPGEVPRFLAKGQPRTRAIR